MAAGIGNDVQLPTDEAINDSKEIKDCFEKLNRATFRFNQGLDKAIIKATDSYIKCMTKGKKDRIIVRKWTPKEDILAGLIQCGYKLFNLGIDKYNEGDYQTSLEFYEKIFEKRAIEEELSAYTALVPDHRNLKATMMLEYTDESVRRRKLRELKGIERGIWFQVGAGDKIFAIADEDLEREDRDKTSAVHFLRFPISEQMREEMRTGAKIMMGVKHPSCQIEPGTLSERTYQSLLIDMN